MVKALGAGLAHRESISGSVTVFLCHLGHVLSVCLHCNGWRDGSSGSFNPVSTAQMNSEDMAMWARKATT